MAAEEVRIVFCLSSWSVDGAIGEIAWARPEVMQGHAEDRGRWDPAVRNAFLESGNAVAWKTWRLYKLVSVAAGG